VTYGYYEVGQESGGTALRAGSGKVEKPRGGEVTWALFQSRRVGEGGLWLEMKGKLPIVDEGEPTGVEKDPTGLAS